MSAGLDAAEKKVAGVRTLALVMLSGMGAAFALFLVAIFCPPEWFQTNPTPSTAADPRARTPAAQVIRIEPFSWEEGQLGFPSYSNDPMLCMYEGRGIYAARDGHNFYAGSGSRGEYAVVPVRRRDAARFCHVSEDNL